METKELTQDQIEILALEKGDLIPWNTVVEMAFDWERCHDLNGFWFDDENDKYQLDLIRTQLFLNPVIDWIKYRNLKNFAWTWKEKYTDKGTNFIQNIYFRETKKSRKFIMKNMDYFGITSNAESSFKETFYKLNNLTAECEVLTENY